MRPGIGLAATLVGGLLAAAGTAMAADVPALPKQPVTINIVDVAGNLALTKPAFEKFKADHPELISNIVYTQAPAPELPGKIKAQQRAKRLDIDLVLTGTDALAAGLAQDIWDPVLPAYASEFPKIEENYQPAAAAMMKAYKGTGILVTLSPGGPLFEYAPSRVANPPTNADELLAYCKAHPGKVMYARPANSGPGRAFLMGLPYILGDSNPKDPIKGWDKTWAFLKELNSCIDYYPSGTTATMKEFGEGSRDIVATMTGWDINPRALGIVPADAKVTALKGFHWVVDGHFMVVPKGLAPEKLAVALALMKSLLTPEQQAVTYDKGYFYPGPAVKGVTLAMAPAESQEVIKTFGRPEYDKLIAETPQELPLDADTMVAAFHKWDEEIGASKSK